MVLGLIILIPDIIPEAFRKAFKPAQTEKPGATHIEIPEDVARMETAEQLAPKLRTALDSNKLAIIDCHVNAAENLLLTQRLGTLAMPTGVHPCIR